MSESVETVTTAPVTLDLPQFTTTDIITVPGVPFQPNAQQQDLLRWARDLTGSLNLIARAGCGKSTALMLLVKYLVSLFHPKSQYPRIFMGAFNKAIATELSEKMGFIPGVEVSTMHALGFRLCKNIIDGKIEIDSKKVKGLAHKLCPWDKKYKEVLTDLVGYAKQSGFGVKGCPALKDKQAWTDIADHYDIWDELPSGITPERLFNDAYKIYNQSLSLCQTEARIDFDDMILVPLVFGGDYKPELYDWVLVDEAQDQNMVRRLLAQLVLKTGGRMVAVGDNFQAIYGFSGASHDSLEQIKKAMNAKELPLSVTYRCPKLIVEKAQQWVPDIQAHESAPQGTITLLDHKQLWGQQFSSSDVILCRNTRPLVGIAQRLRRQGVQCVVEGNSGRSLIGLVTKWGEVTLGQLRGHLANYLVEQKVKWTAKERPDKLEAAEERVGQIRDMAAGLDDSEPVRRLVAHIESLFGQGDDDRDVLRLCTIHRSKGREWDRVFWIGPEYYHPSKWAKSKWEMQQERNLEYVVVTRSKRELVEVGVEPPVKGLDGEMMEWWEF
jgi:DNA helicase-2/ATP-dependent DNA helicase PcrA